MRAPQSTVPTEMDKYLLPVLVAHFKLYIVCKSKGTTLTAIILGYQRNEQKRKWENITKKAEGETLLSVARALSKQLRYFSLHNINVRDVHHVVVKV